MRAVLFDLFDTLVYSPSADSREAVVALVEAAGVSRNDWRRGWHLSFEPAVRGDVASLRERVALALKLIAPADPEGELVERITEALRTREDPQLYPDVPTALAELRRRGYRLGLVSNIACDENRLLMRLGIDVMMDELILSCTVHSVKPEPEIYRIAAAWLRVAPQECAFVDDITDYVEGARRVGMTGVRIDRPNLGKDKTRDTRYDMRIENLQELLEWLPARAGRVDTEREQQ